LEGLAKDKHSSLLGPILNYEENIFLNIGPSPSIKYPVNFLQNFFSLCFQNKLPFFKSNQI
jgi:hypothetical protein